MTVRAAATDRTIHGYRPRLVAYAVGLIATAIPVAVGAVIAVAADRPTPATVAGVTLFLALTLLAELKPVPLDEHGDRLVSLAFIFVVSGQILFGWEYGVLISALALLIAQTVDRTAQLRLYFNVAAYTVSAFAASVPALVWFEPSASLEGSHFGALTALSFVEGAIFVGLNVILVCVAIALHSGQTPVAVLADHLRHSGPAFAIMAFIAALAVALWTVWPPLLLLLTGPLFALALFQRYALRTAMALRAAGTDSLTGLKNHRSYEQDLAKGLADSEEGGGELTLCLIDIDNFKKMNDEHGHPTGDSLLTAFAELTRSLGPDVQGYRLGGDEFALIVDAGEERAIDAVRTLRARLASAGLPYGEHFTFSAGIAGFPEQAEEAQELLRVADVALYWTKRHGKNRWCVYSPSVVERSWPAALTATVEYDARLRAAENLIRVVDARDTYTGSHSQSVAALVEMIGESLELPEGMIAQLRLAGLLHDLGKISVPDAILQKPSRLDPAEQATLRKHPQTGFELLEGLDVSPVDVWILHHHEHWDGAGYPHGLRGEEIPLGSRIILVADAFDAMTTERRYRGAVSVEQALAELSRNAGTQFDPKVVAALQGALNASTALAAVSA
jgi:diguanylate cyclase (GGDEF)-like protein